MDAPQRRQDSRCETFGHQFSGQAPCRGSVLRAADAAPKEGSLLGAHCASAPARLPPRANPPRRPYGWACERMGREGIYERWTLLQPQRANNKNLVTYSAGSRSAVATRVGTHLGFALVPGAEGLVWVAPVGSFSSRAAHLRRASGYLSDRAHAHRTGALSVLWYRAQPLTALRRHNRRPSHQSCARRCTPSLPRCWRVRGVGAAARDAVDCGDGAGCAVRNSLPVHVALIFASRASAVSGTIATSAWHECGHVRQSLRLTRQVSVCQCSCLRLVECSLSDKPTHVVITHTFHRVAHVSYRSHTPNSCTIDVCADIADFTSTPIGSP